MFLAHSYVSIYIAGKEAALVEQWESSTSSEMESSDDPGGPSLETATTVSPSFQVMLNILDLSNNRSKSSS